MSDKQISKDDKKCKEEPEKKKSYPRMCERFINVIRESKSNRDLNSSNPGTSSSKHKKTADKKKKKLDKSDDKECKRNETTNLFSLGASVKKPSPLQEFDLVVSKELMRRKLKDAGNVVQKQSKKTSSTTSAIITCPQRVTLLEKFRQSTLEELDQSLSSDPGDEGIDPELKNAIDRLYAAQTACLYDSAVKAAEEAASSVPPQEAEEAAAASVRDYIAEVMEMANDESPTDKGHRPVEVIGYLGVTKLKRSE